MNITEKKEGSKESLFKFLQMIFFLTEIKNTGKVFKLNYFNNKL